MKNCNSQALPRATAGTNRLLLLPWGQVSWQSIQLRTGGAWVTSNAWKLAFCSDFCGHQPEYLLGALLFQAVTEANRPGRERSQNNISATLQDQTWESTLYFSVPLIDNDNTPLFMGGCHRSYLSGWWTEKCEIILWNSSVKHKGKKDALLVNTGFAPGRIEGSGQTRRGEKSVVKRPACTCKLTAGSVLNVMLQALEWRRLPGWFKSISKPAAITCSTHLSWEDIPVTEPGRLFQSVDLPQTASNFPHSPTLPLLANTLLLTPFSSDPFSYPIDTYRTLATCQTLGHR